jgi:hypothetical protein
MASAAPKTLELPPKLGELYRLLDGKGDVDILEIYTSIVDPREGKPLREAQQYLGPYITKLNRRLREHRKAVKPGRIKGTYCLCAL